MKRPLQALLFSAAFIIALGSCKTDDPETTTDIITTTTTTTTYEGDARNGGEGGAGSGNATGSINASNTGADANGRTVYVNERRRDGDIRKKKVVVRSAYTPGNFPESSERLLTDKDVVHLSAWGKKLMKNEIFARHGMTFSDPVLKAHFAKQNWYDGKHKNVDKMLTSIERQNLETLNN